MVPEAITLVVVSLEEQVARRVQLILSLSLALLDVQRVPMELQLVILLLDCLQLGTYYCCLSYLRFSGTNAWIFE